VKIIKILGGKMKKTFTIVTMILMVSQVLLAGSISGTVSGNPANGLMAEAFEPGNPQQHYVTPVENGAYTITDVEFGTYIVKLSGMGIHLFYDGVYSIEDATPVDVTAENPNITGIDFAINAIPQGMITGSINSNGGPGGPGGGHGWIEGSVLLYDQIPNDPNILPVDETQAMGMFYSFHNLEFGTYYVALEIEDEATLYYDMVEDPDLATAIILDETNPVAAEIDFFVEGAGPGTAEVNGVVTDDNGTPVAGAMVELITQNGGMPWFQFEAVTDENGNYAITEIPADDYYLVVMAENFLLYFYDGVTNWEDATIITIAEDDIITIDPIIQPLVLYQVTGTVLDDEENPVEECLVSAFQEGNGNGGMWSEWTTYTLEDGTFELNVPEGNYYFAAHIFEWMNMQIQYYDHQENWQDADVVTVDAPVSGIDFDFVVTTYNAVISGTITDNDNLPIEEANAFLYPVESQQWFFAHSISDENGFYEIDNIPVGDYYLSIHAQNYLPYFYDGATNWEDATIITIAEDDVITIDPILAPMELYTISGTILDDAGNPMTDVMVFAHSNNWNPGNPGNPGGNGCNGGMGNLSAQPDETGFYEMEVPAGEYIVGAETMDFMNSQVQFYDHKSDPNEADVVLVEDDVTAIDFDFAAPATYDNSISGLISLVGLPVENAMVVCMSVDETFSTATFTNELGQYELDNLPENDYYIHAFGEGGVPTFYPGVLCFEEAIAVTALGFVTGIDFELVPINGSGFLGLNGYVYDTQNQPIANTTVTISDLEGNVAAMAMTNGDGFYETSTVISGEVEIAATKVYYNTSSTATTMNQNTSIDFTLEPTVPTGSDHIPISNSELVINNYPNPFNPNTTISFNLPNTAEVTLEVFNVKGQLVNTLVKDQMESGIHSVVWNGLDSNQKSVSSGIYFYKIISANESKSNKMILMK